jgi:hypothetical protein
VELKENYKGFAVGAKTKFLNFSGGHLMRYSGICRRILLIYSHSFSSYQKIILVFFTAALFLLNGCGQKAEDQVSKVTIDGIPHVKNPQTPLKGTITLALEKQREINPYEHEEIGLKYYKSARDHDGEVILFDVNNSLAERFSPDNAYLGPLFRKGQGPGEFSEHSMLYVHFKHNQIWATGRGKLAKYNKEGRFLEEFRTEDFGSISFLNDKYYIIEKRTRQDKDQINNIMVRKLTESNSVKDGPILMDGKNMGMISNPNNPGQGFGEDWGTPDIEYAADCGTQRIYLALCSEYKICVKDTDGKTLNVIERPYEPVKINREDKEKLLPFLKGRESFKWAYGAFPDRLNAVYRLHSLPNGYLAVYRIAGVQEYEIDVFDSQGRYVYILKLPENVKLSSENFYDFGFSTIEVKDDFPVYVEYRITNLPEIFSESDE